jgi:hypothetical protein
MKNWIVALGLLLLALTASPAANRIERAQAPGLHAATTVVAQNGGDDDDDGDDEDGEEDFI